MLVGEPNETLVTRVAAEAVLHCPHLLDTEVLHVLRRFEQRGDLTARQVEAARDLYNELALARYPHHPDG